MIWFAEKDDWVPTFLSYFEASESWPWVVVSIGPENDVRVGTFHGLTREAVCAAWLATQQGRRFQVALGDANKVMARWPTLADLHCVRNIAVNAADVETLTNAWPQPFAIFRDGEERFTGVWRLFTGVAPEMGDLLTQALAKRLNARPVLRFLPLPADLSQIYKLARDADGHLTTPRALWDGPEGRRAELARRAAAQEARKAREEEVARPFSYTPGAVEAEDASVSLASVRTAPIDWLWPGRIARKKLHLIGGEPGKGKSQLCAYLAARVTRGGHWPCGAGPARQGGGVLWFGSEEDPAEEIKPRVEAAGADIGRIRVLRPGWRIAGGLDELDREARLLGDVRLLVLDPINAAVGSGAGTNDRLRDEVLSPLLRWAAQHNAAVVGILHPPKNGGASPAAMFGGFKAFREVARVVMFAGQDLADRGRVLLLVDKANALSPAEKLAHAYRFVEVRLPSGVVAPRIEFEAERVNVTMDGWLARGAQGADPEFAGLDENICSRDDVDGGYKNENIETDEERRLIGGSQKQVARACQFLMGALAEGPRLGSELKAEAAELGIPGSTLDRAADEFLGVVKTGNGVRKSKTWSLP